MLQAGVVGEVVSSNFDGLAEGDHVTGMLRPGLAADLVVLDRDVLSGGPSSLLDANVLLTMMNGQIVHSA